jgi:glycine/serine hydroxymethyltransferase
VFVSDQFAGHEADGMTLTMKVMQEKRAMALPRSTGPHMSAKKSVNRSSKKLCMVAYLLGHQARSTRYMMQMCPSKIFQ